MAISGRLEYRFVSGWRAIQEESPTGGGEGRRDRKCVIAMRWGNKTPPTILCVLIPEPLARSIQEGKGLSEEEFWAAVDERHINETLKTKMHDRDLEPTLRRVIREELAAAR
jgi:hypothetical protein